MKALLLTFLLCAGTLSAQETGVFRVKAERAESGDTITQHGSGVGLGPLKAHIKEGHALVLTAAHVVTGAESKIYIETRADVWVSARVVRLDLKRDLALLEIEGELPATVALAPAQTVEIVGSPKGEPVKALKASISEGTARFDMAHGLSGAAVLNAKGELIGLLTAGLADVTGHLRGDAGTFVSVEAIRDFLEGK